MALKDQAEALNAQRERALEMGGPEKVEKHRARGKLTVRERIAKLFDPESFVEFGILAEHPFGGAGPEKEIRTPADGLVTGFGDIDGRQVAVMAYDFTVFGGSIGPVNERKAARLRELVLRRKVPLVWLVDSAGARIHEDAWKSALTGDGGGDLAAAASAFADTGYLFREQVTLSGYVPQVAAMMGPGFAGTAYIPGLADFVPMVKGTSFMGLAGPALVKAAIGETVDEEKLGGSKVHCEQSGCADLEVANDEECLRVVREYLSYMPSCWDEEAPIRETQDPIDRRDEALLTLLPEDARYPYEMRDLVRAIVDDGRFFELKPRFATSLITAFGRFGGRAAGIIANNPKGRGGILDNDSSDKGARFIILCNAFGIPLVFLQDVPGFMVGSKAEREGIIRHGAKMVHAVAMAEVQKITVIVRRAYGAGYYAMCGAAFEPDHIVAWPCAEISVMGPEGMVSIMARKAGADTADPAVAKYVADKIRQTVGPMHAAQRALLDDVIDPRDTRRVICQQLRIGKRRALPRPRKRHGVWPV